MTTKTAKPKPKPNKSKLTEAQESRQKLQGDPALFAREILGIKPSPHMKPVLKALTKPNARVGVKSGSAVSKSFTASVLAIWFLYAFKPSTVITTAPTWRQVIQILWKEMRQLYFSAEIPLDAKSVTKSKIDVNEKTQKWYAIGLSTKEPERFQGMHNDHVLVIVDEASGVPFEIFTAIENPLSSGDARLLLIGNPTQQTGGFRDAFSGADARGYKHFTITAFNTPNFTEFGITLEDIRQDCWQEKIGNKTLPAPYLVTPQWVANRHEAWGEGSFFFQAYVMGKFPEGGVNNLMKMNWVEDAIERSLEPEGEKIGALDVARYGDDESVYGIKRGKRVYDMQFWSHQDSVYTAGRTHRIIKEEKVERSFIDSVGVGAGVFDLLREQDAHNCMEFNYSHLPAIDSEKFFNRRAELYWDLARIFEAGEIDIPDDNVLKAQLCDIRYEYTERGKFKIESKEKARGRGSRSPDRADVLMMLFAPVADRNEAQQAEVAIW